MLDDQPIPFFRPELGQAELDEVVDTLRSGWLTTGPKTRQFEEELAAAVGARHAVAVNSATAALHLSLLGLGIGPGDEVIVPTMTFAATSEVVLHCGARPVLVDCEPRTLNLDPAALEAAMTPRTKGVIPVHYGGHPCDMDAILAVAEARGLKVVEDAAHALPARYRGRPIGSVGHATCFSFYANKTITTGEGGMLATDSGELAERARLLSLHGLSRGAWDRFSSGGSWNYQILAAGFKYNLTDIAASIGLHQLRKMDALRRQRAQVARWYHEALADVPETVLPQVEADVEPAWHLYPIRLDADRLRIGRDEVIRRLGEAKIGTSVHWLPLHMHPYYRERFGYRADDFPIARAAFERLISLPIFPSMTQDQVERVADALRSIVRDG